MDEKEKKERKIRHIASANKKKNDKKVNQEETIEKIP